jgi:calcium/calmodulin-dependent protein kinase I
LQTPQSQSLTENSSAVPQPKSKTSAALDQKQSIESSGATDSPEKSSKKKAYVPPAPPLDSPQTPLSRKKKSAYTPPSPLPALVSPPLKIQSTESRDISPQKSSVVPSKDLSSSQPNQQPQRESTKAVPQSPADTKVEVTQTAVQLNDDASLDLSEGSLEDGVFGLITDIPHLLGSLGELLGENTDITEFLADKESPGPSHTKTISNASEAFFLMSAPALSNEEVEEIGIHDTPQPSSESGMRFDELYRLKGVLGSGAFSTVREGFHRSNQSRSYAVKCINRKKLSDEDEAALLDEVSILTEMRNDHIIRLYDFFTEPSTYYLVMERMRGGELFDRIVAKAYYNEKEARDTCLIVLEAIGYCHDNHIAHRDLKPENLLLLSENDDSAVKIADFGFAKRCYAKCSLTTQCGTPGYVAPEILEGSPYDERADMWSVGVILYILLGGYPPFIESTQRDLFRKIRKGDYEFHEEYWGTVSTEAKDLIRSLLTVSIEARLTADEALENKWILGDGAKLAKRDLGANLQKFRNFNAKRKFRAAVNTVMAINKLNSLKECFFTNLKESTVQAVVQQEESQGGKPLPLPVEPAITSEHVDLSK